MEQVQAMGCLSSWRSGTTRGEGPRWMTPVGWPICPLTAYHELPIKCGRSGSRAPSPTSREKTITHIFGVGRPADWEDNYGQASLPSPWWMTGTWWPIQMLLTALSLPGCCSEEWPRDGSPEKPGLLRQQHRRPTERQADHQRERRRNCESGPITTLSWQAVQAAAMEVVEEPTAGLEPSHSYLTAVHRLRPL